MEKHNWDELLSLLKENEEKIKILQQEKVEKHAEEASQARIKKLSLLEKTSSPFPWKEAHSLQKEQDKILHTKDLKDSSSKEKSCSCSSCSCEEIQKEQELYEFKNKYLRLLAETENMRKRLEKDKEETLRYAIEDTIKEFLLPLDNFESALKFASKADPAVQQWAVGFQMILTQFRELLHKYNITAFHSEGSSYNPHEHEVLEVVETNDFPDKTILSEFSKGYKCGDKILRPARVKISKTCSSPSDTKNPEDKEEKNHDASETSDSMNSTDTDAKNNNLSK